jgi:hypothetical protein
MAANKKTKFAKVQSCTFTTEWLNPINKKLLYYHDIVLDNGDTGSCGTIEKNSYRIKKGSYIEYEVDEKGKMKVFGSSNDKVPLTPTEEKAQARIKGQETFLGYAWSYAKDLMIAGHSMEDIEEVNKMARFIYEEMGKMLNNEPRI